MNKPKSKGILIFFLVLIGIVLFYNAVLSPAVIMSTNNQSNAVAADVGLAPAQETQSPELYSSAGDGAFASTYSFIAYTAKIVSSFFSKTGFFNIKTLGIINILLLLFGLGIICFCAKRLNKVSALFLGLIFFFIFANGQILPLFNSFYTAAGDIVYLVLFFSFALLYGCADKEKKFLPIISIAACTVFGFLFIGCSPYNFLYFIIFGFTCGFMLVDFLGHVFSLGGKLAKLRGAGVFVLVLVCFASGGYFSLKIPSTVPVQEQSLNAIYNDYMQFSTKKVLAYDTLKLTESQRIFHMQTTYFSLDSLQEYTSTATPLNLIKLYGKDLGAIPKSLDVGAKIIKTGQTKSNTYATFENSGLNGAGLVSNFGFAAALKERIYPAGAWFYLLIIFINLLLTIFTIIKNGNFSKFNAYWCSFVLSVLTLTMFFVNSISGAVYTAGSFYLCSVLFDIVLVLTVYTLFDFVLSIFFEIEEEYDNKLEYVKV